MIELVCRLAVHTHPYPRHPPPPWIDARSWVPTIHYLRQNSYLLLMRQPYSIWSIWSTWYT
jgi:hypothetical protein